MDKNKKEYLTLIEALGILPNFFISEPYLDREGIVGRKKNGWLWLEEDGLCLFPPVSREFNYALDPFVCKVWADFENLLPDETIWKMEFLDSEFIFDPKEFMTMAGGKWETFRKNSRKWVRNYKDFGYVEPFQTESVNYLLADWLEDRKDTMEDAEFLVECVLDPRPGISSKYLLDHKGNLAAINIWDENYKYINYRFCICRKEPFLDEFARLVFYQNRRIQNSGKLVNDGGCLGNFGLERFKDKMNPLKKRAVRSWNRIKLNHYERIF